LIARTAVEINAMPFVKGQSGNPAGRPKGIIDKRQRLQKAIQDNIESVIQVVNAAALQGDMSAAALLLSRAVPTLKAESGEIVQFAFDATQSLSTQLAAIAQAVADGELSLDQGKQFMELATNLARARALENGGDDSALVNAFREFAARAPV
jgi:hypothetical protein